MSVDTCFGLIRLLIVVSLLVLVSSLAGSRPHCPKTDPNNPCPPSCSPHSPSCG
ncbi:hypothetical protein PVAP13_4KG165315 [Panicum virgatum]|uniref:Uncharacterized protein n=1 Tax=Panicum virgatum TaxID=38727 RepID=A0A8T0TTP6_PANVG|nr:hypothetical protein PVAP13_4KG165315 [Panicum virgatum]